MPAPSNVNAPQMNQPRLKAVVDDVTDLKAEFARYRSENDRRVQVLHTQNQLQQSELQMLKARLAFAEEALNIEADEGVEQLTEPVDGERAKGGPVNHEPAARSAAGDGDEEAGSGPEDEAAAVLSAAATKSKGIKVCTLLSGK
ncbi:hypothetical protein SCP_0803800 [Sparassis crispa]|uniref:Uncharacterized protein n=1 Tax=Sparassis crispa TaxID=139825 RepID=A0A401GUG1_9APHY|nr:hypothetical protein SCP_0803800 [Sparassis crispa]GBE85858.1 hypothetical protein SCP_0803800 [Sparassis crispa]